MEGPSCEKEPLGPNPKVVHISKAEMHLAYLHRQQTGEPIQTWIRRLIRENWQAKGSERLQARHDGDATPRPLRRRRLPFQPSP